MTDQLPSNEGLLILPHLRVQNANAISSPLTHGFPSMTAFVGLMWALQRRLQHMTPRVFIDSVGVVCHGFDEQVTEEGFVGKFRLARHPVDRDGGTAAIVEEGRVHLDLTLIFGVTGTEEGNIVRANDESRRAQFAASVADVVAGMRIAGGSVLPSVTRGRRGQPQLIPLPRDAEDADAVVRNLRRLLRGWLPGFALVSRDDLLRDRIASMRTAEPASTALDAWMDLSRFNWRSGRDPETDKVTWSHDRTQGWIVPIPVGYAALSDLHEPGVVRDARDNRTRFRFVESLHSIGQWISPHRLEHPEQLLWYPHSDEAAGIYRCRNDYARNTTSSLH